MDGNKSCYSYRYLLRDIVKCIPYSFVIIVICNLCLAAAPSIVFVLSAKMFDRALDILHGGAPYGGMLPYVLGYLCVYLVLDQISMFSNLASNKRLFEYCSTRYKILLSKKASRLEMRSLDSDTTEDLKRRAITCIEQKAIPSLAQTMIELFFSIFSVASVVFVLSQYSIWFIPVAVFSVCPYFIIKKIQGEKYFAIRGHQVKSERIKEYIWALFSDKQCMKELHTMGFGEYLLGKWAKVNSSVNEEIWAYNIREQGYNLICEVVRISGYFISVGLALMLSLKGIVSIGALGACLIAFQTVQEQMSETFGRFGESVKLLLFIQNYCEFMNLKEEKEGTCEIGTINTIKVRDLSYKYPNAAKNVLKHIDITINKGEKIALVGENGSGKTTFVKCLLGIYTGQEGSVLYNNINAKMVKRQPEQIGVVEQNIVKYYFTVKDTILMGDYYTCSKEEVANTFREVGLGYLTDKADFMDQQLGSEFEGIELSGGEWQRLAIARCILKKPELLILDEPTSALDPICENDLLLKMLSLVENSTSLIITHRVGICQSVDRIIVMKDGRIAECGNHEELILKNGEYKRLYDMQRKWYI